MFETKTVVVADFLCRCIVCVFACVIGRQTTTTSTPSVTVQDLGGEWPSHTEPGPALDYQSPFVAQSAVSIHRWYVCECTLMCVSHLLIVSLEYLPLQPDRPPLHILKPATEQSHGPITSQRSTRSLQLTAPDTSSTVVAHRYSVCLM